MKLFAFLNTSGEPQYTASPSEDSLYEDGQVYSGLLCKELPLEEATLAGSDVLHKWYWNGTWKERAPRPGEFYRWNNTTEQWEAALADAKAFKWKKIKEARTKADVAGFVWNTYTFDSSVLSSQKLQAAAMEAMVAKMNSTAFSTEWTLADNSTVTLTADEMLAVACCLRKHQDDIHKKGRSLRAAIDAATTLEEVEAIVW